MSKHLASPNYFRLVGVIWFILLIGGLALEVSHVHYKCDILTVYTCVALLVMGGLGMFFFRPRT